MGHPDSDADTKTRPVVDRLYAAFLAGDAEGMLSLMSDDVWVRFLGIAEFRGIDEARRFFTSNQNSVEQLDFRIEKVIVDGERAAVLWEETARTSQGHRFDNHGVDVLTVRDGRIVSVHENNDIRVHRRYYGTD